jgi:hypothetical protein
MNVCAGDADQTIVSFDEAYNFVSIGGTDETSAAFGSARGRDRDRSFRFDERPAAHPGAGSRSNGGFSRRPASCPETNHGRAI